MKNKASFIGLFSNPLLPDGCKIDKGDPLSKESLKRRDSDDAKNKNKFVQEYCIEVPDIEVALTILNYRFRKYSLEKELYMIPIRIANTYAAKVLNEFFNNKNHRMVELGMSAEIDSIFIEKLEKEMEAEEKAKKRKK